MFNGTPRDARCACWANSWLSSDKRYSENICWEILHSTEQGLLAYTLDWLVGFDGDIMVICQMNERGIELKITLITWNIKKRGKWAKQIDFDVEGRGEEFLQVI